MLIIIHLNLRVLRLSRDLVESFLRKIDHTVDSTRREREGAEEWLRTQNQHLEGTEALECGILFYFIIACHIFQDGVIFQRPMFGLLVFSVKKVWSVNNRDFSCPHWFQLQFCILQKLWSRINLSPKVFWVIFSRDQSILKCKEQKIHRRYEKFRQACISKASVSLINQC